MVPEARVGLAKGSIMPNWRYKVEIMNISEKWNAKRQAEEIRTFEARLKVVGAEGWELVNYDAVPMTGTFSGNVKGYAYLAMFKQQIP
jgi:hypothetical protein